MSTIACLRVVALFLLLTLLPVSLNSHLGLTHAETSQSPELFRKIPQLLEFPFESSEPIGSAKNPAVILPASTAALLGDLPAARRAGNLLLVPVAELQKAANQPLIGSVLTPIINRVTKAKSFDGFSAIDGLSSDSGYDSLLSVPNTAARRISGENFDKTKSILRTGDLVFGSHVVNWMTWGRYIHVGIVSDAARGKILEATANGASDKPGVQENDWNNYAKLYGHIGVVRIRNVSPEQIAEVIRWIEARKGRPYRWPILMGIDNNDESRFYCSQLIWRAFKQVMKLDLDSDQGALVFPDDLYNSRDHVDILVP
jgi:uncharacterized protein YycO